MEKRLFRVKLSRELVQKATVMVMASSELEAEELALRRAENGTLGWGETTLAEGVSAEEEVNED